MRRFTTVARLKHPWGKKGALTITPEADADLTKLKGRKVFIAPPLKEVTFLKVNEVLAKGKHLVIFFEGIDSIEVAEMLEGRLVQVESDAAREIFIEKQESISGFLCATDTGKKIGNIKEILDYPAHSIIVVDTEKETIMIPFVPEFVKEVSYSDRKVIVYSDVYEKNWGSNA